MPKVESRPIAIVNSGAYVEQELAAEFGVLPPAFLPVGFARLYEFQAQFLTDLGADLYITLPGSFRLSPWDEQRLESLGFSILRTPDGLSIGGALLYALGCIGFADRPLHLLHGDTLVEGIDLKTYDVVAVSEGGDGYRWAHVELTEDGHVAEILPPVEASQAGGPRLCGYFALGNARRFAEALAVQDRSFLGALAHYRSDGRALAAVRPSRWLDFGHVQTFFLSRRIVTTERVFNSLQIGELSVRKRSATAEQKLRAEAQWLREVPGSLAPYCARLLAEGEDADGYFYDTQYEYMPTLAELYIFGKVTFPAWARILDSCRNFIDASVVAAGEGAEPGIYRRLVLAKTSARLEKLAESTGLRLDAPLRLNGRPAPSLSQCLRDIEQVLADTEDAPSVMHGDFCFSNILYSFRTRRIRVIDPRAIDEAGAFNPLGDRRYDLAKLMHSICGRYDAIIAGQHECRRVGSHEYELNFPSDANRVQVEGLVKSLEMGGVRLASPAVWAGMVSLFLSMPPLHHDRPDRQIAFIANALRLRLEMDWIA